jgi:hypothetical protein
MRRSLAGNFEASSGGDGGADAAVAAADAASRLSEQELRMMLDVALKLAAENKITDRNVWSLPLLDHLPDMVQRAAPDAPEPAAADAGGGGGGGGTTYFTRISGGLDAGVQIYARRVDATWKAAMVIGSLDTGTAQDGAPPEGVPVDVGSCGAPRRLPAAPSHAGSAPTPRPSPHFAPPLAGEEGADGSQGAGEPKRRRRGGAHEPREDDTLADAAALKMKALDSSFVVDPLFHHMSQLFDEDGAQGARGAGRGP